MYGKTSVWYGAVIKGDKNTVKLGTWSSVQDRAVIQTVSTLESGFPAECVVGRQVTVGPSAVLTSCTVKDGTQIGAGAIIGAGSIVGENCHIAAGAVVEPGTFIPASQLWAGNPASYVRDVSIYEVDEIEDQVEDIWANAEQHSEEFLPYGNIYTQAETSN
jgi:carbonic anhydrase/acetyltransferase-like protein (isoleucine patch superfamily)